MINIWETGNGNLKGKPNLFTQKASDSFAYSNGDLATVSSSRWSKVFGAGSATVTTGSVTGTSSWYVDANGNPSKDRNQYAQVTPTFGSTGNFGLLLRRQASNSGYLMYYDASIDELTIQTLSSGTGTTILTINPVGWASQGAVGVRFSASGIGSQTRLFVEEYKGTGWRYVVKNVNPTGVYFDSGTPGILFGGISMTNWVHGVFSGISAGVVGVIATKSGNTSGATSVSVTIPTSVDRGDALAALLVCENGNVATAASDSRGNTWTVEQTVNDGFNSASACSCLVETKLLSGDSISITIPSFFSAYSISILKLECCSSVVNSASSQVFASAVDPTPTSSSLYGPIVSFITTTGNPLYVPTNSSRINAPIVWGASSNKLYSICYYPGCLTSYSLSGNFTAAVGQLNTTIAFDV